ncbi:Reverse transcriptase (RNA-dependent DNA polymerase) [Rubripirellula tenax]|uniref:Reverse transcriptase (RNA-dependent DNA polymerase) n=1 Tax=Rubripirellula tenax TaxID=2528015 RepID=A0A5C6EYX1_9BACT|nr:Reverse transcriptase (RNA-dependent DNA polymerase) [Rubripirellula tenax]
MWHGLDNQTQEFKPKDVAIHPFLPFIGRTKIERRYKRDLGKVKPKERPLRYAAHKDARIYSRYAQIVSQLYEHQLAELGIAQCVLAYRKTAAKASNITAAKEAFDFIETFGECDVVTVDVTSFFENLDHERLKELWCRVLGCERIPSDHFAIFKQLTRYRFVDLDRFLDEAEIKKASLSRKSQPGQTRKRLSDMDRLRELFKREGVVQKHDETAGIPQGSPASAVLSNLYMLDFDAALASYADEIGGLYRRYSDDILIVAPVGMASDVIARVRDELEAVDLKSNKDKESFHEFRVDDELALRADIPVEYLGFEFDGARTVLKQKTITRYQQRATRLVKNLRRAAQCRGKKRVNRKKIFDRCTHIGRRNFVSYARRSAKTFYPDSPKRNPIMRQLRNHVKFVEKRIERAEVWLGENVST